MGDLDHQNLVRRLNEEAHPTPQPHPLGSRLSWAIGIFYWTICVMFLAFVVGFLQGGSG